MKATQQVQFSNTQGTGTRAKVKGYTVNSRQELQVHKKKKISGQNNSRENRRVIQ
jgi:hypothetical protein